MLGALRLWKRLNCFVASRPAGDDGDGRSKQFSKFGQRGFRSHLRTVDQHLAMAVGDDELRNRVAEERMKRRHLAAVFEIDGRPVDAELCHVGLRFGGTAMRARRTWVGGGINYRESGWDINQS